MLVLLTFRFLTLLLISRVEKRPELKRVDQRRGRVRDVKEVNLFPAEIRQELSTVRRERDVSCCERPELPLVVLLFLWQVA